MRRLLRSWGARRALGFQPGPRDARAQQLRVVVLRVRRARRRSGRARRRGRGCMTIAVVGQLADDGEVVADEDVGDAGARRGCRRAGSAPAPGSRRRARRRTRRGSAPRLGRQGARDRDALALAAGQGAREGAGLALVEPDQLGQLAHPLAARVGRRRRGAGAAPRRAQAATVWRGSRLEYGSWKTICTSRPRAPPLLAPSAPACERSRPQARIVPAVGALEPDDHPGDGRLARARLADDRQRAARLHRERHVVDGDVRRRTPCAALRPRAPARRRLRHGSPPPAAGRAARRPGRSAPARRRAARSGGRSARQRVLHVRAARRERAARRRLERRQRAAGDRREPRARSTSMSGRAADERRRVGVAAASSCSARRRAASRRSGPAYITAVRSHTAPASSRSWVMNSSARPRSRRSSSRIAITSACVVTSSAVVGSSASSSRGSASSAAAIITRCSRPPDSSCGYCRSRRSPSAMPTSASSLTARRRGLGAADAVHRAQRLGHEVADPSAPG